MIKFNFIKIPLALLALLISLPFADENSYANDPLRDDLCLYVCPYKTTQQKNLIVNHDIFILSQNKETKFADWVAYQVTPRNINANVKTLRSWKKDPKIQEENVLIPSDYKGAHKKCDYDRGHQAPLTSFKGSEWEKTNYVSNLTPQKADLNRGPWLKLENKVRKWVKDKNKPVYVMTGTYYNDKDELCTLETTRVNYKIPSGYWKIIAIEEGGHLKVASFMFPQNAERKDDYCKYESDLEKIKNVSQLKFFNNKKAEHPLYEIDCN